MIRMKIHVHDPIHSENVQDALFKLGYSWSIHGDQFMYTDREYLFGTENGDILQSRAPYDFDADGSVEYILFKGKLIEKGMVEQRSKWEIEFKGGTNLNARNNLLEYSAWLEAKLDEFEVIDDNRDS